MNPEDGPRSYRPDLALGFYLRRTSRRIHIEERRIICYEVLAYAERLGKSAAVTFVVDICHSTPTYFQLLGIAKQLRG